MQDLNSPHNEERCICSDYDQLEDLALKECRQLLFTIMADLKNIERYLVLAGNELAGSRNLLITEKIKPSILELVERTRSEIAESNHELLGALTEVIVHNAVTNCPYCKF